MVFVLFSLYFWIKSNLLHVEIFHLTGLFKKRLKKYIYKNWVPDWKIEMRQLWIRYRTKTCFSSWYWLSIFVRFRLCDQPRGYNKFSVRIWAPKSILAFSGGSIHQTSFESTWVGDLGKLTRRAPPPHKWLDPRPITILCNDHAEG